MIDCCVRCEDEDEREELALRDAFEKREGRCSECGEKLYTGERHYCRGPRDRRLCEDGDDS